MTTGNRITIVVPGDQPVQIQGSPTLERLKPYGDVVFYKDRPETFDEKIKRVEDAEVIINSRGAVTWDARALNSLPKLRMIALISTGTDMVNLDAASELGIVVSNVPGRPAHGVAEHLFCLMLAVSKHLAYVTAEMKAGRWARVDNILLRGKTLGIIGTGNVGGEMARLARSLGMDVVAWTFNPSPGRAAELEVRYVELDELLSQSDVVSLSVRLTDETQGMLGERELGMMKRGALLVNAARGGLVDMQALVSALDSGCLAGAALDVYDVEPIPQDHPILSCDKVVLTPHNAFESPEGLEAFNVDAVENVIAFLEGRPRNVVTH